MTHEWVQIDKGMLSRILYPNPLCILSVVDKISGTRNVMTITWLTPINNHGGFICSLNRNRHTAHFVEEVGSIFVLNVPIAGMEELVLNIGSCTGADVDKITEFKIATCRPGNMKLQEEVFYHRKQKLSKQKLAQEAIDLAVNQSIALRDCIAHVVCQVIQVSIDEGHLILRCQQLAAFVDRNYWNGRNFMPRSSEYLPYMTFLGSKTFGYVHSQ